MANELKPVPRNPFLATAERLQRTGEIQRSDVARPRTRSTRKAILNFIPDPDALHGMIDQALAAVSRGVRWARGSILNLLI